MNPSALHMHRSPNAKSGLTFTEVLLAVLLLTLLLGTASQVLYSLVHFWQDTEKEPIFLRHVEGVTGFLAYAFDRSNDMSPDRAYQRHGWQPPPGENRPTFYFRLEDGHPFFVTEVRPLPRVDAWLLFEPEEGLSLLWHIPARYTERSVKLRRTLLSSWVQDVEIGYYDSGRNVWEYESLMDDSADLQRGAPGSFRIIFDRGDREIMRYVRLHRYDRNVLRY